MPKDTIQLKDGIVYINNKAIEEKVNELLLMIILVLSL